MKINKLTITNFRALENIMLNIEDDITIIVGKNNTGKTSLFEAIGLFTTSDSRLSFEEFSQSTYEGFKSCLELYQQYVKSEDELEKELLELELKNTIPKIQLSIEIEYDQESDSLVNLSEFLTDLDESRNDATILLTYEPQDTLKLYSSFLVSGNDSLIDYLKNNITSLYHLNCYAKDKESDYSRVIDGNFKNKIKNIVSFEDVKALRVLDDKKGDRNNTLGLGFAKYYKELDKQKDDIKKLETALDGVSKSLKVEYANVLKDILEDLKNFGASTPIVIPEIEINSEFDSETVIKNNIKYYYKHEEVSLPESYNGLGYSNLIYMILELTSFIEKFNNKKGEKISEFLTVLIEEPEAHMHPQMQQVFVNQIQKKLKDAKEKGLNIQLILNTHSTHVIVEAGIDLEKGFDRIRYFNRTNTIEIKDFNHFKQSDKDKETFRFLKQYLNLHKCDIFFADKVILVEGITEKLLLPQMIGKVAPSLKNEYISVLEVGGAYTHKFKNLLDFIGVKTLIITDIDSIDSITGEECFVNRGVNGELTSNETLKQWIPKYSSVKELVECLDERKLYNNILIAYQNQEEDGGHIARSLEEAIINCNLPFFCNTMVVTTDDGTSNMDVKNQFSLFKTRTIETIKGSNIYDLRPKSSNVKTNFAFDLMTLDESVYGNWNVPNYIKEGLQWLAGIREIKKEAYE